MIKSLDEKPQKSWLRKIHECGDEKILRYFLKDLIRFNIENNKETLELLWECCQIPDFVKKTYGNHIEVVSKVFGFLNSKEGRITNDFMRLQLMKLDKLEGKIELQMLELGHMFLIKLTGLKIRGIGLKKQNY